MKKYYKKSPFKDEEHLLYLEVSLGNTKQHLFLLLSSFLSFFFLLLSSFLASNFPQPTLPLNWPLLANFKVFKYHKILTLTYIYIYLNFFFSKRFTTLIIYNNNNNNNNKYIIIIIIPLFPIISLLKIISKKFLILILNLVQFHT